MESTEVIQFYGVLIAITNSVAMTHRGLVMNWYTIDPLKHFPHYFHHYLDLYGCSITYYGTDRAQHLIWV